MFVAVKSCKIDWVRCDPNEYIRGPLTYLVLLYVDSTTCPGFDTRAESPISFWTHDVMTLRKDQELKNGGYGLDEIRELYYDDEDYDIESKEEVVDLSKGDDETGPVCFYRSSLEVRM